jgi:hypothetical protein
VHEFHHVLPCNQLPVPWCIDAASACSTSILTAAQQTFHNHLAREHSSKALLELPLASSHSWHRSSTATVRQAARQRCNSSA